MARLAFTFASGRASGKLSTSRDGDPPGGQPFRITTLSARLYFDLSGARVFVVFIGTDRHVHELFFAANRWQHDDLTTRSSSPQAVADSRLAGYVTTFNNQQHLIFVANVDGENHVSEMFHDAAGWHPNDLTDAARLIVGNTPAPVATTALVGYQTAFNGQQHVIYQSADNHVRELFFANNAWRPSDLTAVARGPNNSLPPTARGGTALDGYATEFNRQQHVNFISTNAAGVSHVNEFWFDTSWHWNDLTNAAVGVPVPNGATPLDGYVTTFNGQQHVNFVGPGRQVFELFYLAGCTPTATESCWRFTNLSTSGGIPGVNAVFNALNGYQTSFNGQQHVNFISQGDNRVRELFFAGQGWQARDLTSVPANPAAATPSGTTRLTGYETFTSTTPPNGGQPIITNKQHHVHYVDTNGHVHELIHGP